MTLTERQQKYCLRMFVINSLRGTSAGTFEEQQTILRIRLEINASGSNFGTEIRRLIQELSNLEDTQKKGLSPKIKELYEDLKDDYG